MHSEIIRELHAIANREKAETLARFFKTGPGQYGEGDRFLGITVPQTRSVVRKYRNSVTFDDIEKLLASEYHEIRVAGVLFLVGISPSTPREAYEFYLAHAERINNWDLVDLSAPDVVGKYLLMHPEEVDILNRLAVSPSLWERRIAMVATFAHIRACEWEIPFRIARTLLGDPHDLIHKATGWMLREVGKRCGESTLESFLNQYVSVMPRTALRYAIERLPEERRRYWMGR